MDFEIIDDVTMGDVACRFRGSTFEKMCENGARGLMSIIMEDIGSIRGNIQRSIRIEERELDILLVEYLQEFIFYKDSEGLLLLPLDTSFMNEEGRYSLEGVLRGEEVVAERHSIITDIKAVTYHNLRVIQLEDGYEATVTVDV